MEELLPCVVEVVEYAAAMAVERLASRSVSEPLPCASASFAVLEQEGEDLRSFQWSVPLAELLRSHRPRLYSDGLSPDRLSELLIALPRELTRLLPVCEAGVSTTFGERSSFTWCWWLSASWAFGRVLSGSAAGPEACSVCSPEVSTGGCSFEVTTDSVDVLLHLFLGELSVRGLLCTFGGRDRGVRGSLDGGEFSLCLSHFAFCEAAS